VQEKAGAPTGKQAHRQRKFSLISASVLSMPSTDGMKSIPIGEGNMLYSVY
jgi:hypothetical protein